MVVCRIPREPFLGQSERLLAHLLGQGGAGETSEVLEIGCGPDSPLLPMFWRLMPEVALHQIDARPDVIEQARARNPAGRVEQMMAADLSSIPSGTKQLVVAMSVYDQNAEEALPQIAREIHRVLCPGGRVIYLHNEELNPPATHASVLYRSFSPPVPQEVPRLMLPSDAWRPTNDVEYCTGLKHEIEQVVAQLNDRANALREYVVNLHPGLSAPKQTRFASGKTKVPFVQRCTPPLMTAVRDIVAVMRRQYGLTLQDHSTADLMARKFESVLFSSQNGFDVLEAGVYEQQTTSVWSQISKNPLEYPHVVRGVTKFGYLSPEAPAHVDRYRQQLRATAEAADGEVVLTGYQYGLVAIKQSA